MVWDISTLQVSLQSVFLLSLPLIKTDHCQPRLFSHNKQLAALALTAFPILQVKRHFRLSCDRLLSVSSCGRMLWCCKFHTLTAALKYRKCEVCVVFLSVGSRDSILEVWRNGTLKHCINFPEQQRATLSSALLLPEVTRSFVHPAFVFVSFPTVLKLFVCLH